MSTALAELVVKLTGDVSDFEKSMEGATGSVETMGSKIASVGAALGTAVVAGAAIAGAGLVALGVSSVGVAREFESSMAIMSTAVDPASLGLDSAAEAMGVLGEAALAVGSDTQLVGVSASGAAEAITGLYKAGLSTSEIFGDLNGYLGGTADLSGALRASVDLAAASELDMVQASELAAITLATFGGELTTTEERAQFVNDAMNNFVQTADASVASVQGLADAMVNVGPTAAAMGIGFEDVNTALGILSMRGIQGAEAGTALKSMLTNLTRTTPDVTGTLKELGVSLYDMDGAMRPLPAIIADLEAGMAGMTEEQRNQTIVTLAGTYGMNAMNALLGEGAEGWTAMEDAIGNAATMQETAAARANTLQGAQEQLAGVIETLQIRIGTALIPVLTTLAGVGAALMEKYGPALVGVFETFAAVFSGVIEAVGNFVSRWQAGMPLITNIQALIMQLGSAFGMSGMELMALGQKMNLVVNGYLLPFIARVQEFVSAHGPQLRQVLAAVGIAFGAFVVIQQVVAWVGGLIAAFGAASGAISAAGGIIATIVGILGGPLTIAIAAVAAAIGLLAVAWNNNWGGIQEKTAAVWAAIKAAIEPVVMWIQTQIMAVVGAVIAWWNASWPTIQATFAAVWAGIQSAVQTVVGIIGPTVQGMIETVRGAFAGGTPIIEQFKGLWASLGPLFQSLVPVVQFVGQVIGAILMVLGGVFVALVGIVVGVVNGIVSAMGPLVSGIMGAIQAVIGILTGLVQFVTGFWNTIVGLFTGNQEKVQQGLGQMGEGIMTIWTNLVNGVVSLVEGFVGAIIGFVTGLVDGVIAFFTNLYQTLVGGSIVPDMVNAIIGWFENLSAMLLSITEGIRAFVEAIWSAIQAFMEAVWTLIVAIVTGNIESARSVIEAVWSAVQGFWEATWSAIQAFTESLWNALQAFINATLNTIQNVITSIWNAVKSFWEGTWNAIQRTTETIWTAIKTLIQNTITTVQNIITSFVTTIQNVWSGFLTTLQNLWSSGWSAITNIMETGRNTLTGIANSIVQAIFGVFNQDWGSIGRGIVDGIGGALSAGLSWVADQARGIAEAALAAAMAALGIGSPSREFAWLGEMSVQGYTNAFRNVRPIEGAVVRGLEAGVSAGQRVTNQSIDRGTRIGTVNVQGGNGLSLLRQMEAAGVRK